MNARSRCKRANELSNNFTGNEGGGEKNRLWHTVNGVIHAKRLLEFYGFGKFGCFTVVRVKSSPIKFIAHPSTSLSLPIFRSVIEHFVLASVDQGALSIILLLSSFFSLLNHNASVKILKYSSNDSKYFIFTQSFCAINTINTVHTSSQAENQMPSHAEMFPGAVASIASCGRSAEARKKITLISTIRLMQRGCIFAHLPPNCVVKQQKINSLGV